MSESDSEPKNKRPRLIKRKPLKKRYYHSSKYGKIKQDTSSEFDNDQSPVPE